MPKLHLYRIMHDMSGPLAPVRVQIFTARARLLLDQYLAEPPDHLQSDVAPGECVVRVTLPSGQSLDQIVDVGDSPPVVEVGLDPAANSPQEWLRDAAGQGVLDELALLRHPTVDPRYICSVRRHVWVRLWEYNQAGWRPTVTGLAIKELAGDYARLALPPAIVPRAIQTGGPGSLWHVVLVPPSPRPTWLLIAASRTIMGGWSATSDLFAGPSPRESLLRSLNALAPVNPTHLWKAAAGSLSALDSADDPLERRLVLALAGLLALRLNLGRPIVSPSGRILMEAAIQGRQDLEQPSAHAASDLMVVAAWLQLLTDRPDESLARQLLLEASQRGLPAFAYALDLLDGGLCLLEPREGDALDGNEIVAARRRLRPFVDATVVRRGYTSYFGYAPDYPSVAPVLGDPIDDGQPLLRLDFPWLAESGGTMLTWPYLTGPMTGFSNQQSAFSTRQSEFGSKY